jgi:hypothetical protein
MFQKVGLFLSSGEGNETPTLLDPIESRAAQTFSILDALVESRFSQGTLCQILISTP